ncbi:unnamed protein product [Acanthosepion pharaonis]|uniref:Uncharacterized protein n=1 Tax=Acanthosepion pharaonis TaxID=158019 RepID=A0A812D3I1_ACAPH|nr:unnamed protein product [Sepia pharaonis]
MNSFFINFCLSVSLSLSLTHLFSLLQFLLFLLHYLFYYKFSSCPLFNFFFFSLSGSFVSSVSLLISFSFLALSFVIGFFCLFFFIISTFFFFFSLLRNIILFLFLFSSSAFVSSVPFDLCFFCLSFDVFFHLILFLFSPNIFSLLQFLLFLLHYLLTFKKPLIGFFCLFSLYNFYLLHSLFFFLEIYSHSFQFLFLSLWLAFFFCLSFDVFFHLILFLFSPNIFSLLQFPLSLALSFLTFKNLSLVSSKYIVTLFNFFSLSLWLALFSSVSLLMYFSSNSLPFSPNIFSLLQFLLFLLHYLLTFKNLSLVSSVSLSLYNFYLLHSLFFLFLEIYSHSFQFLFSLSLASFVSSVSLLMYFSSNSLPFLLIYLSSSVPSLSLALSFDF